MAIRATWRLVERFEDRSDGIFYLRKYFLERDWIFEGRIGNSIEVATITGILRIAGPLFPSLEVGNPQSAVSLSLVWVNPASQHWGAKRCARGSGVPVANLNQKLQGCPPTNQLKLLAENPRKAKESVLNHISSCSPSYRNYSRSLQARKAKG